MMRLLALRTLKGHLRTQIVPSIAYIMQEPVRLGSTHLAPEWAGMVVVGPRRLLFRRVVAQVFVFAELRDARRPSLGRLVP